MKSDMNEESEHESIISAGLAILDSEATALQRLRSSVNGDFARVVVLSEQALGSGGRLVLTGVGKSGLIARKLVGTLVSTGTPALFLDPQNALHGDLGAVVAGDLVLCFSYSGETEELLKIMPGLKRRNATMVAITRSKSSSLGRACQVTIELGDMREADPLNLVPTTSTTCTIVLGDALAITLMKRRNFTPQDFAALHPGGTLGRKLTLTVEALIPENGNPCVHLADNFERALEVNTRHLMGAVSVIDDNGSLAGIITDGDIRRIIQRSSGTVEELRTRPVAELMTANPMRIDADKLAFEALLLMEGTRKIMVLPVVDNNNRPVGMVNIHHIVQAGLTTTGDTVRKSLKTENKI